MRIGSWQDVTLSADTELTDEIDIDEDYEYLDLQIPSMAETQLYLQVSEGSDDAGTFTYYNLGDTEGVVMTDLSTFNRMCVWQIGGFRFIKIGTTIVQPSNVTIRVRGRRHF